MNKKDLESLIKKYNLDDTCKSVIWKVKEKNLVIDFVTENTDVCGTLEANIDIEDGEFGIYDTKGLLGILPALDSEFSLTYHYERNKPTGLTFNDKVVNATYMLNDLSIIYSDDQAKSIERLQKLKDTDNHPEFDLKIELKKDFVDRYIKSKKALGDALVVAIIPADDEADFVINYSSTPSNRITIPVKCEVNKSFDMIGFNASMLLSILSNNTDFRTGTLQISSRGLMVLDFVNEDSKTTYFVKSLDLK